MGVQKECATDLDITPKNDVRKHRLKQRFDVRQKLGQGTYGKVQLAVNKDSGQEVAIKTIKKSKIESEQDLIRIRREIQIMSSIQHPHIIHIYEVFENKDKIVLVMQFASGGELYDYLSEKKVLSDLEARRIFRQIAAAVYYCHKNKICHRDLKLENILLDEKGNAKIADFGLSNVFDERHLLKTYCGSPLYASPEIVKGVPYYGPEVDCWSMGVLLYTLVYGAMPFDGSNFKKLVTQISEGDYFEPKKKSKASDLIHKLLTVSPLKRATIVDICTDQWVNQGYEHSLLQVAEDMANLTPVRLDLLLALAPASPIPTTDDDDFREEESKDTFENDAIQKSNAAAEDDEDEEEEDEDNAETATNSFAFVRASQASNLCGSTRDIQQSAFPDDYEGQDEFLPVDVIAALENHCTKRGPEQSFDGSISRVSSMAHKSKKPRKSDSMLKNKEAISALSETSEENNKKLQKVTKVPSKKNIQVSLKTNDSSIKNSSQEKSQSQSPIFSTQTRKSISKGDKLEDIGNANTENVCDALHAQTDSENQEKLKPETKRRGRSPGKIIIPKTFESPQSTPSPKAQLGKSPPTTPPAAETGMKKSEKSEGNRSTSSINQSEDANNTVDAKGVRSDSSSDAVSKSELVSEEKKQFAKGILKKGIAKAKLAERRLSQQSSTETEVATPPPIHPTAEVTPSFFKAPTPYIKEEEEKHVQSKAQIILSPPTKPPDTTKSNNTDSKTPLWDSAIIPTNKQSRNLSWGTVDSTIDSDMNNWREQMEESLRRLSPENDRERSITSSKPEEDEHLVPIARSYKKFTFTKDGACITETKKIYTTPGADGSWTKVEKKTRITTRPGNAEEFEKLRDLHLRNDSPLTKSDSQSSTGSTEVYDDIFDSWTGDTMMCNMMKIKNMFQKFSRDPFLRTERRRNPFRNFRRTESDRNERSRRRPELRSGQSTDKDSSDNEEDYEVSFDSSNPVVYGSQGLWQFLRSSNKRMPRRVTMVEPEQHSAYTRSVSQDRSEAKHNSWKRTESRASSGYNTGSRSQSRDRTQSPHEKVLRFVFESPSQMYARSSSPTRNESWCFKKTGARHNPRRDSGVGSDGYESEHSYKRVPSDDLSKSGRISPVYNSSKQGLIHDFVKSWPKEMASQHEASSGFTDTRRHKVEQWLHMNDMNEENFPFGFQSEPKMSTRKANIHDNLSSTYATMRPREFMKYSRSSSDKVSDSNADYFSSFDEGPRCSRSSQIEAVRNRFRNAAYSPVSEESRETHSLHHSDSSHSSSSVHRINFTISDGRVSTSLTSSPQSGSRQAQSFVLSPGEHVIESNTRNAGPPVVQMRVSFNHGNRENKVLNITSQAPPVSSGLWQQQESPRNTSQTCNIVKETSPVPGIKKFSTEMVHKVGNNGDNQQSADNNKVRHHSNNTSIECEVKTSLKNTPKG